MKQEDEIIIIPAITKVRTGHRELGFKTGPHKNKKRPSRSTEKVRFKKGKE